MTLVAGVKDSTNPAIITCQSVYGGKFRVFSTASAAPASTAWPANNRAYLIPFYLTSPALVVEMFFQAGTGPGTANFDLGIYRDDFTKIVSLGATASVNTTDAILPAGGGDIADTALAAGRYYMAMSAAATTITARAAVNANGIMRALGVQMMDTAHPLPPTVTPVTVGTSAFMPTIGVALITNVL